MLRPSSPPLRGRASRRGKALDISCAPHHLALQGASPRGEALERGVYLKFQTICNSPLRNGRRPLPKGKAFFVTKYLNSCKIVRKQLTNAVFFAKIFSVSVRKRHFYALYADFCGLFSCFFMRNPEKNRFFIFAFFNCVRAIFRKIFYNFTRRLNLCLLSISSSKRAERKSLSNRRVLFSITAPRNAAYVCP